MSQDCDCENIIQNPQVLKTVNPNQGNNSSFCDDEVKNWSAAFNSPHHGNIEPNGECDFESGGQILNCMRARTAGNGFTNRSEGIYYYKIDVNDVDQDNNTVEFETLFKASSFIPNYCVSISTERLECLITGSTPDISEFNVKCYASSEIDDCIIISQLEYPYATGNFFEEIGSSATNGFDVVTADFTFTPNQDYEHIIIYTEVPSSNGHTTTSVTNISVTCNHTALSSITTDLIDPDSKTYSMFAIIEGNHPISEYIWDFGDGASSAGQSPVHSYAEDGEYLLCLSTKDIYGCCAKKCIPITVKCEASSLSDITYAEADRLVRFTAINTSSDDFATIEWDFGDGNMSTELNPLHLYDTYDTYTVCVSITDVNGCCATLCETITISPPITTCACIVPSGTLFLDGNNPDTDQLSDLVSSGLLFDGDMLEDIDIYVDGIFEMDANFTFDCDFYFKKGAGLDISSPGKVEIINSKLVGCTHMWRGIAVNGTQPLNTFWFRGNIIKDAYAAIELKDGCNVLQNSNEFIDNYIGVYARPSNNLKKNNGTPILLSKFTTKGNMLAPYDNQPAWAEVPFAGIHISDLDDIIVRDIAVWGASLPNYFIGIQNGIIVNNTNLVVNGNIFRSLVGTNSLNGFEGRCISGRKMISIEAKKNFCADTGGGFYISDSPNSKIDISNNTVKRFSYLYDVYYGIHLEDCTNSEVKMINNEIHVGLNSGYAIVFRNGNGLQGMDISYNRIHHGIFIQAAIRLSNINFVNGKNGQFNHNEIATEAQELVNTGVTLSMVNNVSFENNKMSDCFGFSIDNSNHNHFRDNIIERGSGFYQENSINNLFCCNMVEDALHGFVFRGTNDPLNLSSNTLDNCTYGLDLKNQIPPQGNKGNLWTGALRTARIVPPSGSTADQIAQASVFDVNSVVSQMPEMRPLDFTPMDMEIVSQWFFENGLTNESCSSSSKCGVDPLEPNSSEQIPTGSDPCDGFREFIEALVGPKVASDFQHQNEWTLFYYVFEHFDNIPVDQWEDCIELYDFMNSNPKIESYIRASKAINGVYALSQSQSDEVEFQHANIKSAILEIQNLYDNVPEDYSTYAPDIREYQETIYESTEIINNINDNVAENGVSKLNAALNLVDELQVDFDFEEKLKTVWKAKIRTTLSGVTGISQNEWQVIETIANGCPDAGGLGLYEARALINMKYNYSIIYQTEGDCNHIGKRNLTTNDEAIISVYPNPTSDILNISGIENSEGEFKLRLYSIEGILMFERNIVSNNEHSEISLEGVNSGIYILELTKNGIQVLSKKIVKSN